jgi:hypothetical protein
MEGEGVILGLGLDKEEATRRELGAELGCSDFKDRCFPGGIATRGSHRRSGVITKEEGTSLERDMLVRPHRGGVWERVEGKVQTLGTSNKKS